MRLDGGNGRTLPRLRAPLVTVAITAVMLLHPAGPALPAMSFLLARKDRRQDVAGILALLATAGLIGAGLLPHAGVAANALRDPKALAHFAAAAIATLPFALPDLVTPLLLFCLEQARPRDRKWRLAAAVALLALGEIATAPSSDPPPWPPLSWSGLPAWPSSSAGSP